MKTTFVFLLLFAMSLAAREMSCSMRSQSMNASASHQTDVEQQGDEAMGFSHDKTTHHFLLFPDGGAIEVIANDRADSESVQKIRAHLTHIAEMFSDGNFSTPMFVHSQIPPGVPIMQKERADITYTFEELPAGGGVRIKSSNVEASFFASKSKTITLETQPILDRDLHTASKLSKKSPFHNILASRWSAHCHGEHDQVRARWQDLEVRTGNPDGSEWVRAYTYGSRRRLLKIGSSNSGTNPKIETTYSYDQAGRMLEERLGADMQIRYEYDSQGRKSVIETHSSQPLPANAG